MLSDVIDNAYHMSLWGSSYIVRINLAGTIATHAKLCSIKTTDFV